MFITLSFWELTTPFFLIPIVIITKMFAWNTCMFSFSLLGYNTLLLNHWFSFSFYRLFNMKVIKFSNSFVFKKCLKSPIIKFLHFHTKIVKVFLIILRMMLGDRPPCLHACPDAQTSDVAAGGTGPREISPILPPPKRSDLSLAYLDDFLGSLKSSGSNLPKPSQVDGKATTSAAA